MSEKKQRVLIVHNYYKIPGGEDTVVANEKRLLEENGHFVLQYSRNNSEINAFSFWRKLLLPFTVVFSWRTYRNVRWLIRENAINVVHVHNTLLLISPAVYYAAWSTRVPVVQTIHNFRFLCPGATFYRDGHICEDCIERGLLCAMRHKCYRDSLTQTLINVLSLAIHRLLGTYRRVNGYIYLTEFTRQKFSGLLKTNRMYIKPNFTYKPIAGHIEKKNFYLFVGRLEDIKGISILMQAIKKLPELKFVLIGSGSKDYEVTEYIERHDIKNTKMLGQISHSDVQRYIAEAKALIMPSQWYETFGMVIIEAYANRTPVIVGNIGNIRGLVKDGSTGILFDYNSVDALVEAIKKMEMLDVFSLGEFAYKQYWIEYADHRNYAILNNIYSSIK